jgi:NmrA-like family
VVYIHHSPSKQTFPLKKAIMAPRYIIPRGSLILVTGANGYIASHVVNILLELGFKVRGTVRAAKPWLSGFFEQKYGKGRFESVVVPALEDEDAWSKIAENVSGVALIVGTHLFFSFYLLGRYSGQTN